MITGPSGNGCHIGVLFAAGVPMLAIVRVSVIEFDPVSMTIESPAVMPVVDLT